MIDSLLKALAGAVVIKLLGARDESQAPLAALNTQPLDDLSGQPAPSTPAPSTPAAIASESAASVPVEPSTPAVPSSWVPVPSTPAPSTPAPSTPAPSTPAPSTPAPVASESATSVPVEPDASELAGALESSRAAAERLYSYIMRTNSTNRDRTLIRSLQAAMGGVAVDGLIGRETAARIRELTGRRIAGLS